MSLNTVALFALIAISSAIPIQDRSSNSSDKIVGEWKPLPPCDKRSKHTRAFCFCAIQYTIILTLSLQVILMIRTLFGMWKRILLQANWGFLTVHLEVKPNIIDRKETWLEQNLEYGPMESCTTALTLNLRHQVCFLYNIALNEYTFRITHAYRYAYYVSNGSTKC